MARTISEKRFVLDFIRSCKGEYEGITTFTTLVDPKDPKKKSTIIQALKKTFPKRDPLKILKALEAQHVISQVGRRSKKEGKRGYTVIFPYDPNRQSGSTMEASDILRLISKK